MFSMVDDLIPTMQARLGRLERLLIMEYFSLIQHVMHVSENHSSFAFMMDEIYILGKANFCVQVILSTIARRQISTEGFSC